VGLSGGVVRRNPLAARERSIVYGAAILLILLRGLVPTVYEGFYFDSDQAIVGLMARHISTQHDFPVYYYSLNYLLAVQAWIIAPFFWLFRSSVTAMRVPLLLLNAVAGVWLIAAIGRRSRLRPSLAFVAALPFIVPTPAASNQLLEGAGASVEPILYVLLLWSLRGRPFAFGIVLAIGVLHREFTAVAVPALVLATALSRGWRPVAARSVLRTAAWAAAGVALALLVVDDLKLHAGVGSITAQAISLGGQTCWDVPELLRHVNSLVTQALPTLFGTIPVALDRLRMNTPVVAGSRWIGWIVAAAFAVILSRLAWLGSKRRQAGIDTSWATYLALTGFFGAAIYPLSCNIVLGAPPLLRYLLLALLLPVGLVAAFLQRERSAAIQGGVVAVIALWGAANLVDNLRVVRVAMVDPPVSEHRVLADYLVTQRIRYARAIYWDAYVIDFLTRERVITASVDVVRIPEYQHEVDLHSDAAVNLARLPCQGQERVASWCVEH
jgi:hypothetical protein